MDNISVLLCDDSALQRNLIGRIVESIEGFTLVGKTQNGQDLLDKIPQTNPDVILLDIEMPVMNGVEFLKKYREQKLDIPVIILSGVATQGASVTMECLSLGASDFITKPGGTAVSLRISEVTLDIVEKIASYGRAHALMVGKTVPVSDFYVHQAKNHDAEKEIAKQKGEEAAKKLTSDLQEILKSSLSATQKTKEPQIIVPENEETNVDVIAIGISTGGPNALREVLPKLDKNIKQSILIVQHMPAGFTKEFASSLNSICNLEVSEATDGEALQPHHIYIAPGGNHMIVERHALTNVIRITQTEPRNGHKPSVDNLFESVANVYKNRALGIIMTGMGKDGANALATMRKQGARTLGQDSTSCIVYGMPKVAYELGAVQKQVPLKEMAEEINKIALL